MFWFGTATSSRPVARFSGTIPRTSEAALKRHYEQHAPADWQEKFVSAYAASHSWEDFAETWAHYLHIVDTLEMATAFGLSVKPAIDKKGGHTARIDFDPYVAGTMQQIMDAWVPFVLAMNNVNRAMGRPDLYPFILAPPVIEKLAFIHDLIRGSDAADNGRVVGWWPFSRSKSP